MIRLLYLILFYIFIYKLFIMKKINLLFAGLALFAISFTSCSKCQDCECFGDTEEICEDDFDSKSEYKDAITILEAFGCTCK
jgi:hypothetical protein